MVHHARPKMHLQPPRQSARQRPPPLLPLPLLARTPSFVWRLPPRFADVQPAAMP